MRTRCYLLCTVWFEVPHTGWHQSRVAVAQVLDGLATVAPEHRATKLE